MDDSVCPRGTQLRNRRVALADRGDHPGTLCGFDIFLGVAHIHDRRRGRPPVELEDRRLVRDTCMEMVDTSSRDLNADRQGALSARSSDWLQLCFEPLVDICPTPPDRAPDLREGEHELVQVEVALAKAESHLQDLKTGRQD